MTPSIRHTPEGVEIAIGPDSPTVVLDWRWLRDHGEDPASFDATTHQRRVDVFDLEIAPATAAAIATRDGRSVLELSWPNAPETTWISLTTLRSLVEIPDPTAAVPWRSGAEASPRVGSVADVLDDDAALAAWLRDLRRFGFARLGGFCGGHAEAQTLAERIGPVRASIFGTTWDLSSDVVAHDDSSYSTVALGPHTDGTYSHEAPGLQMWCCVDRTGTGGESIVVDGMAAAEDLRADDPDAFDLLTRVPVTGRYIEPGVELRASRPPIRTGSDGSIAQVSLNNYDRAPMLLPPDTMRAFYDAYGALLALVNDKRRWTTIRLGPGDVLINDNWRVLHGRTAYTGRRHLIGCYVNHEDFESRCRVLGL